MLKFLVVFILISSCAVPNKGEKSNATNSQEKLIPTGDFDGDFITNEDELKFGLNPKISDYPKIMLRFLQNYKITISYNEINSNETKELIIDTKIGRNNPDFKYRLGKLMLREESYKKASLIAKYNTYTAHDITQRDLTWVKYPEIDPAFYSIKSIEATKLFDETKYEISNIKIELENSARLMEGQIFKMVSYLIVSFHYYDYEKDSFEQIKNVMIDKKFNAGTNETFTVVIDNAPINLIRENFLKKGEFLFSKLEDYYIPEHDANWNRLRTSIENKTTTLVYNTPLESTFYYIASHEDKNLVGILNEVFTSSIEIRENQIHKIASFENNLSDYTHLLEVKDQDKAGKWFALTNSLPSDYLAYKYTHKDVISLSYITGSELAASSTEKIVGVGYGVKTLGQNVYTLGNVSPNSEINLLLKSNSLEGQKLEEKIVTPSSAGGSCGRNCSRRHFQCDVTIHRFPAINDSFDFSLDDSKFSQIWLKINNTEYQLSELIKEKKISYKLVDGDLLITIKKINEIQQIYEFESNVIELIIKAKSMTAFEGVKLVKMSGRHHYECPRITTMIAHKEKLPISEESDRFRKWRGNINWKMHKVGKKKTYHRGIEVDVSSTINNFFN